MQGTVYIYHPSYEAVETHILTKTPDLKYLRGAVGGHIELVPYFNTYMTPVGKPGPDEPVDCVVFCNEDGKGMGLPVNTFATAFWDRALRRIERNGKPLYPTGLIGPDGKLSDVLVGSIIIVTGDADFMSEL